MTINMLKKNELIKWAKKVKERDNYICHDCCNFGDQAHHFISKKELPEFAYELWMGITLCVKCNRLRHKLGGQTISLHFHPFYYY